MASRRIVAVVVACSNAIVNMNRLFSSKHVSCLAVSLRKPDSQFHGFAGSIP